MLLIGLLLALVATTADNLGVVLQASQARKAPPDLRLRVGLVLRLVRMRLWIAGGVLLVVGVALQTTALAFAPLTLVQAAVGFGVVVLVVASSRVLGERLSPRQMVAAVLLVGSIIGVAMLSAPPAHRPTNWEWLGVISAAAAAVAAVPYIVHRRSGRLFGAAGLAIGAGAAYAADAALLKAIADAFARDTLGVVPVLVAILGVLGVAGFLLEETALTAGRPTTVNPIIMLFQVGVPIALGPLVFDENVQPGVKGILLMLCFAAAVLAAVELSRRTGLAPQGGPKRNPRGRAATPAGGSGASS